MIEIMEGNNQMELNKLIKEALATGFTVAAEIKTDTLRFMPEVRNMCKADLCHSYNKNWTCPPACGTIEECAARASKYSSGILVQCVGNLEDSFDIDGMEALSRRHKECFEKLLEGLRSQKVDFLSLGAGACTICTKCSYPDNPCRFPDKAVTSMEASGLWVSDPITLYHGKKLVTCTMIFIVSACYD
jgi:predicted metal-binding protein